MEEERDVSKFWNNGQIRLRLIGLENQMKTDKYMPLRVIGYDGAAYRARFLEKPKKPCYPIITLVLYFGTRQHWNRNLTLKEVVKVPNVLDSFVNDYKINVFELAWLTDKQIDLFKSDFHEGEIGMCDVIQRWVDEGSQKKAIEDARNFLAMDVLTPEQVAQGTGLPLEQVLELQKQVAVKA